jgi:hypothetical protein
VEKLAQLRPYSRSTVRSAVALSACAARQMLVTTAMAGTLTGRPDTRFMMSSSSGSSSSAQRIARPL